MQIRFKTVFLLSLALMSTIAWLFWIIPHHRDLTVSFLDVGQGDSILFRTPQQHLALIDGGPRNTVLQELDAVLAPWERTLDLVILTHADRDHLEGLVSVFDRYRVRTVLLSGAAGKFLWQDFLDKVAAQGTTVLFSTAERDLALGDLFIDVLYPETPAMSVTSKLNETSVTTRMTFGQTSLLFSGDAGVGVEERLVRMPVDLCAQVFKMGHHGSRYSNGARLLQAMQPTVAVGSIGRGNQFSHPHPETLARFREQGVEDLFRTDRDGRVTLTIDSAGGITVRTARQDVVRRISAPKACNFLSSRS